MENSTEKCIRCGKETGISVEIPIEKRYYYVDGSGQMCKECYEEVYGGETGIPKQLKK